jgi:4-amino-4-deoxy-L-arabinose transferase-like glycosyltransferase
MLKKVQLIIFLLILAVAFLLRFNKYSEFPIAGESADEFAWTILGASLIQEGRPVSWSFFSIYNDYWITEKASFDIGTGQKYPLVSPVFDHPPLFALLPGLAQTIRGEQWSQPASAKVMRFPMIFLGVLNVALLYLVSRKLFDNKLISYVPVLVYATAPLFVFSSRLVLAENLITSLVLATIWLLHSSVSQKKQLILLTIISTIAVLTKMAGIIVPVTLMVYGVTQKNTTWKAGFIGLLAGLGIFTLYGAYYDWQLFVTIFSTQASRGFGLLTLHNRLFLHPGVVTRLFIDGWLITGLLATILLMYEEKKKHILVSLFFILNLLFILFFVDEKTYYAWYDFPVFPLFSLSVGYLVSKILTDKKYLLFSFFWLLLLPTFRFAFINTGVYYQSLEASTWIGRVFVALGLMPWMLAHVFPKRRWAERLIQVLLVCILLANILAVLTFKQDLYWATDSMLYERGYIFPE